LPLRISSAKGLQAYSGRVTVRQKEFAAQNLTVEPRFVTPPEAEMARITRERDTVRKIYATFTPRRYFSLPLQRPLPGAITSEFGTRRLFNNEPRSRHMGLDFRGAEGSEVRAIAAGRVVLAADHFFPGLMVIVDHGLGVYSSYMHLSAFKAEVGQFLNPGDLIGLVGSTGRVTGPHLHLDFVVQGERQSPEPFMPDLR
jgi:murein DD-endopeptidase MepM/ murein hydrolase activator NlpD